MANNARDIALITLNRCFLEGAWASLALYNNLELLKEPDKALCEKITLGVIQNYSLLDFTIDKYCKKLDPVVRNILRIGAYQLLFLNKIPSRAAINETVELCRNHKVKSATGLVNAVLHKIDLNGIEDTDDLSIKYSQPKWFVDRLIENHGIDFANQLLFQNNQEAPINRRKAFNNEIYVQDDAAYESIKFLDLCEGNLVLDCCAAPGGKSFTSSVMMNNKGKIISCDIHENKLNLIRTNAKRLGIEIIYTQQMDATKYNKDFDNKFDVVIADVPCSGFGVMRKKPEIRFKTEDDISVFPRLQKDIIDNVSRYVKIGGKLLYSTCTIFKEENEFITHSLKGFRICKEKTFYPNIDGTDGFYACVLIKNEN